MALTGRTDDRPVVLVRVFEGSDCQRRWMVGPRRSTDAIVYGTVVFAMRVRLKPISEWPGVARLIELNEREAAKRKQQGGEHG